MTKNSVMIRKNCVLCNSVLDDLLSFDMPVYMGVHNDEETDSLFEQMLFSYCSKCGEVQIKTLIDPEILYQYNHNKGVIGDIWKNHYIEFSELIKDYVQNKNVVEIGDPSAKLAKITKGFNKWTIFEPNPETIQIKNVNFIRGFFKRTLKEKVDVIIHSHVLEHMYNPIEFISNCSQSLKDSGEMFFSIPNMEFLIDNNYLPNNILHFEHTYYIDDDVVDYMIQKNGMQIEAKYKYENHSIFYHTVKNKNKNKSIPNIDTKKDLKNRFYNLHKKHMEKIFNIKQTVLNNPKLNWYLFGAHVSSQYLLRNGFDEDLVKGILDNSEFKHNKKLYGTKLLTFSPKIISNIENVGIVCSHAGIYYEEISNQLRSINEEVYIL